MKWLHVLKLAVFTVVGLFACRGQVQAQSNFFSTLKLEATVVVTKHQMGSDLVEITVLGTAYPAQALSDKISVLGKEVGDEPRGVQIEPVGGQFLKANFAVNGLINDHNPRVDIAAITKALAFGSQPIRKFSVFFQGVAPDKTTPSRWFAPKDTWLLEGMAMKNPAGIEYRVQVNTQDPNEIYMPDNPKANSGSKPEADKGGSKIFILAGVIVGAIAIGVLVYSALLRPRPNAR